MTTCPSCGKPVDPIRSRFVGVKAGKVVAYCSAACLATQAGQESRPTAVPKRTLPTLDSGPVIEILHEPASGVVTSAARAQREALPNGSAVGSMAPDRREPVARAQSEPRDEWAKNAELIQADASEPVARSRRGLMIALFVAAVAAVAAFVAYKFIFVTTATSATVSPAQPVTNVEPGSAAPAPPAQPPTPVTPVTPAISAAEALDKAKVAIAKNLRADSPRVQRLAAAALARTGDRASSELLVAALKNETSDLAKLELAYALARGGDARGTSALTQALASSAPDPRRWAAERLVRLAIGEPEHPAQGQPALRPETTRAIDVLAPTLEVPAHRLVSAELLAQLAPADPRALKVLDAIRADAASAPEVKARATVALGLAGRADVAPALHELLAAGSERPAAAVALAHLHDGTARPVLVEQLGVANQRVRAARALRALEPALDPAPLLPALLAALTAAKDAEQVDVGEAVLVLCGPAVWSARE